MSSGYEKKITRNIFLDYNISALSPSFFWYYNHYYSDHSLCFVSSPPSILNGAENLSELFRCEAEISHWSKCTWTAESSEPFSERQNVSLLGDEINGKTSTDHSLSPPNWKAGCWSRAGSDQLKPSGCQYMFRPCFSTSERVNHKLMLY